MISLDSIINRPEETVMLFNEKAKVIYVNKTGKELSGKRSGDVPGKTSTSIVGNRRVKSPVIRTAIKEVWSGSSCFMEDSQRSQGLHHG
ncbi:MAG: hypothetical protein VST72_09170 [Nitrospirota bacterium]|nr:hypothetical protein [Nitrospirota bacterium]